ncbi:ABC transporter ATP-binding protein [Desulfosporosinus youngiae]|uniref:ABC-type cobalamin/Fe3+-siderophore transport system, ATPase component n=1 Tax=Desulfosporosinus youngiae DSM 17734 TaxID=768710 RepID=H5XTI8_9FIRM|nr:ABC transporter ATP-binding protein [Desulfosporosinus youngiae]EHQ88587.1 ABC-type cobalamin/Fe3+-siderophore transport system, ATPase component [Desulfosporosinus youngiae DSM 17734]
MSLFDIIQVQHQYGTIPVLQDIQFQVKAGETFGIIGPNGSGKSTLIHAMSGFLKPSQGKILLNNRLIGSYRKRDLAKFIAVLEQEGIPPLSFTVEEVVAMGRYPWLNPLSDLSREDEQIVEAVLKKLNLWNSRTKPVNNLSGGQRQMVSLARAMAQQPQILILDEPTTYLDIGHQMLVMEHVREWHRSQGITVIMVLHDLNLASQYCERLLLLDHGRIKSCGEVHTVLQPAAISAVYKTELIMINHPVHHVPQFLLTDRQPQP